MKTLPKIASILFCFCSITAILHAQVPQIINYQGRVLSGSTNFDGSGQFKFALVNTNGTTTYWSNNGSSSGGSEPSAAVTLTVTKGLYSVLLGDTSIANMTVAVPSSAFTNSDVRLRVWFNDGTHGSQLLTPDQRIAAVGYTFMADNIKDNAITTAKIATGAVGSSQLGSNLTLGGTTNGTFSGSGSALTSLSAANIASGGTLPALNGSALTNLNASNITTGTLPAAQLPATVALRTGGNNFTGLQTATIDGTTWRSQAATAGFASFMDCVDSTGGSVFRGIIGTDGTGFTGATNQFTFATWTNSPLAFYTNQARRMTILSTGNVGIGTANPTATLDVAGTVKGTFSGDGSALTNLNASSISTGVLANSRTTADTGAGGIGNHANTIVLRDSSGFIWGAGFVGINASNITTGVLANSQTTADTAEGGIGNHANTIALRDSSGFIHAAGFLGVNASDIATGLLANSRTTADTAEGGIGTHANTIALRDSMGLIHAAGFVGVNASDISTGILANSRTTADTGAGGIGNHANTIVLRDGSGNFSAVTITAAGIEANVIDIPATTSATNGVIQMAGTPIISARGSENIFLGSGAGNFTFTGSENTGVGALAMNLMTAGNHNSGLGDAALYANSGSENTAAGYESLCFNTGNNNTAVGYTAGRNMSGSDNTAVGASALLADTSGFSNTAVGSAALANLTTGTGNIAIGVNAGSNVTTQIGNIQIGTNGPSSDAHTIRIGNSQTATFIAGISGATAGAGVPVLVNAAGQLGTTLSSRRFKTDIKPMEDASSVLLALKPVTFRYKPELDAKGIAQFGLIAEEVAEICPDLVIRNEKGELLTVRYEQVNAMLLNEFLKQHKRIAEMKKEEQSQLAELRSENATLRKDLAALVARDKEREARLTRLEISMPAAQPVANTIASNKTGGR